MCVCACVLARAYVRAYVHAGVRSCVLPLTIWGADELVRGRRGHPIDTVF